MPRNRRSNEKVPKFGSDAEAAEYFDSHDTADLAEALPEAQGPVIDARTPLKPISLRLPPESIEEAKRVARQKGVGYQTLLRMWIHERLADERKQAS